MLPEEFQNVNNWDFLAEGMSTITLKYVGENSLLSSLVMCIYKDYSDSDSSLKFTVEFLSILKKINDFLPLKHTVYFLI
jgi:hypothetical protein